MKKICTIQLRELHGGLASQAQKDEEAAILNTAWESYWLNTQDTDSPLDDLARLPPAAELFAVGSDLPDGLFIFPIDFELYDELENNACAM